MSKYCNPELVLYNKNLRTKHTQSVYKVCIKCVCTQDVYISKGANLKGKGEKMKTVLICNQKGGVGKTLIADELAFALERDHVPFNFYDMDEQGSAIHETKEDPEAVIQIVDTPGALQSELADWIKAADFIIVPTMMSNRDAKPLERMVQILEPYNGKKPILYVFNCWRNLNIKKQFIEWFHDNHPDLKTTVLRETTKFNDAGACGRSIRDIRGSRDAFEEIDYIYSAIKYELNIKIERTA